LDLFDFSPFNTLIKADGIVLVEAPLANDTKTGFTAWNHDRVCLIRHGQLTLDFIDGQTILSDREIVYIPAGIKHRWITSDNNFATLFMTCYSKHFFTYPPALFELLNSFENEFPRLCKFSSDSTIHAPTIRYLFNELLKEKRAKPEDQKIVTLSLFISLMTELVRSQREVVALGDLTSSELSFSRSLKYLEKNIQEKIGITELADIAGLSYRRYTEVFKSKTGFTANEYIRKKRIELAQQLLLETGNILHASLDAGFGDLAHFYRVFKQICGTTPKQYITTYRSASPQLKATSK